MPYITVCCEKDDFTVHPSLEYIVCNNCSDKCSVKWVPEEVKDAVRN